MCALAKLALVVARDPQTANLNNYLGAVPLYGRFLTMYDVLLWWGSYGALWMVLDCNRSLQRRYVRGSVGIVLVIDRFKFWLAGVLLVARWWLVVVGCR